MSKTTSVRGTIEDSPANARPGLAKAGRRWWGVSAGFILGPLILGVLLLVGVLGYILGQPGPITEWGPLWPVTRPWLWGAAVVVAVVGWWLFDRWRWRIGRGRIFATTRCRRCGYDLKDVKHEAPAPGVAMPTATCPECGWMTGMIYSKDDAAHDTTEP